VIVLLNSKIMPIRHAIVCLWFIFLAECETLNLVDVGRCTRTAWTTTHTVGRYCQSCQFS